MGLILDSSVVIAAERCGDTVEQLIKRIVNRTGDQEAALSEIGLTEIIHGIYRARTPETSGAHPEAISESDGDGGYLEAVRSSAAVYRTSAGVVRREGQRDGYWNSSFCRHSYPQ